MISEQTRNKLTTIAENEQKVYDNGVADGKRAEYDAFWDDYQDYGRRTDYERGFFSKYWTEKNFKPKYPICPINAYHLLASNKIPDLKQHCSDNNIVIDLSQATNVSFSFYGLKSPYVPDFVGEIQTATNADRMFADCKTLKSLPIIKSGNVASFNRFCYNCNELETVKEIDFSSATNLDNSFYECKVLTEIGIIGEIPISLSFEYSPLTPASLKSIIKHLKNYLGTSSEYAYTLTVKASAWEALEAAGFTDEDLEWIEEVLEIDKDTWLDFEFAWENALEVLRWNLVLA